MGLFDGIGEATIGKGGFYFQDGRYVVDIVRCFAQQDRHRQSMFIVEAAIVWSNNAERRPGMVPSWVVMMKWDAALGHVKGFLAACNGADPRDEDAVKACFTDARGQDITEAVAEFSVSNENPLAGTRLDLEVVSVLKKGKTGSDPRNDYYSLHKWRPYDPETFAASMQPQA